MCSVEECPAPVLAKGLCRLHYKRQYRSGTTDDRRPAVEERFWAKVDKNGPVPERRPELGPCHLWTAATDRDGYGQFKIAGRQTKAARFAFELVNGPIAGDLQPDHLCRVTRCVNVAHLELVTPAENRRRAAAIVTHCPQGHLYDEANTMIDGRGARVCRTCHNERAALYQRRRRAARRKEE